MICEPPKNIVARGLPGIFKTFQRELDADGTVLFRYIEGKLFQITDGLEMFQRGSHMLWGFWTGSVEQICKIEALRCAG